VSPSKLLREARQRVRLSQRLLARRAETSQSVVARIEAGEVSPTWDTLVRLLRACGYSLEATLEVAPLAQSHMLDDVPRILSLSPQQRLEEVANLARLVATARRV
jgi:predicted transcriptional regulator